MNPSTQKKTLRNSSVRQKRKSEFKKILKQESNQEKSDDEIEEILNVLGEVKDLKNKSFRNSDQLLKDAIEELD